ncbi:hypothetical protein AA16663_2783 [Komagataeibacter rhaeticus DSM 16663]|nr:hypothetical protein AA16663_2783 [Komagataeibacter rhaeticus DSM 16663]
MDGGTGRAAGTLPPDAFRNFLIRYARACARGVNKADDVAGMRAAVGLPHGLPDTELSLPVRSCRAWAIGDRTLEQAGGCVNYLPAAGLYLTGAAG